MVQEYRVFGGPGTGKTTYLAGQISHALQKYEPNEVYVVSFTKAAAQEIASRGSGIPETNIGTIHAMCYRHSGSVRQIAEADSDSVSEWNETYGRRWPIGKTRGLDLSLRIPGESSLGALEDYNRRRGLMSSQASQFDAEWERFKAERELVDFTDLLLNPPDALPGCRVLFVDEAQDMNPLQWAVVRRWGNAPGVEVFVVAGDDDQILYEFLGARVDEFLTPIDPKHIRVLGKSMRLPEAIHRHADTWIKARLGGRRQPKDWVSRGEGGKITRSGASVLSPGTLVDEVVERAERGLSVMILASCGFLLEDILAELNARNLPFHNPYRPEMHEWNPYGPGSNAAKAVLAWCRLCEAWREDSFNEVVVTQASSWTPWVTQLPSKKYLKWGAKKRLAELGPASTIEIGEIYESIVQDEVMDAINRGDTAWLAAATKNPLVTRSALLVAKNGPRALREKPQIVVGTIHSVKGGEADCVFVLPDVSRATSMDVTMRGQPARDTVARLFYVAMTRAKEEVIACTPGSRFWETI